MELHPILSEDTSSAAMPVTEFNIAAAFPVTDEFTRRVARAKWQRRAAAITSRPGLLLCGVAGLLGLLAAVRLRKF